MSLNQRTETGAAGIGPYVHDSEVFLVRPARNNPHHRYSLNIGNLRDGAYSDPSFVPGMVCNLSEHHRMTPEQAKLYGEKSGRCAWCGYALTTPSSVLRGMGPNCYRKLQRWLGQ